MRALILVDIQNDFLPGGSLAVEEGDAVVPVANRLMPQFELVVATQDWHPEDHVSFVDQHPGKKLFEVIEAGGLKQTLWPVHCVQHTRGAELAPDLDRERIERIFTKGNDREVDSYSGFFDNGRKHDTGLAEYLRERDVTDVYLAGLALDVCVKDTAIDACKLGFETYVIFDATRAVTKDVESAIEDMRAAGVQFVDSTKFFEAKSPQ